MAEADEMTLEELEAALEREAMNPTPTSEYEEVVEEAPAPEPEAEDTSQTDEPVEAEAEQSDEPETGEAQEGKASTESEEEDWEAQERRAREAEWEARAKHWEQVAGRHGQEIGALRAKLGSLGQAAPARPANDDDEYDDQRAAPQRPSQPTQTRDDVAAWAVSQAINAGAAEFFGRHEDAKDFREGIGKYLQDIGYRAENALLTNSPVEAQRETSRVLEEAYWHVKATAEAARRAELSEKRAQQSSKMAEAKKKASISATASAPPPKPKNKTPDEMSADELDKALKEASQGYW